MATQRGKSNLAPSTTITDYASYARLKSAFGTDAAIVSEYSRERSILRKRLERMEAAGETDNWLYKTFGNMKEDLPTARGMSAQQAAQMLASTARALGGARSASLSEIRKSRAETKEVLAQQAEDADDEDFADAIRKMTDKQWRKMTKVMGMVQRTVGARNLDSEKVMQEAAKIVLNTKGKTSVLTMAANVIANLGLDDNTGNLEKLGQMFTKTGSTRVSWKKAHAKRGR